ncbi:hypothetical protein MPER_01543, partial [Moniliophthora perniciosa FA553]
MPCNCELNSSNELDDAGAFSWDSMLAKPEKWWFNGYAAWFARKWYLARRLKVHGIGKGAPGFQTNVRRVRITPEIAARLRREEVSLRDSTASTLAEEQRE